MIWLTRGFMYAGVQCIVATLWDVDESETVEIDGAFLLSDAARQAVTG